MRIKQILEDVVECRDLTIEEVSRK